MSSKTRFFVLVDVVIGMSLLNGLIACNKGSLFKDYK